MKQYKSFSMVGVLIVASAMILAVVGCGNPIGSNSIGGISYAGAYAGTGEDDSGLGNWEFSIDAKGNLIGWYQILSEAQSNCSGVIKADGSFTAAGKTALTGLPFTIAGTITQDKKVDGKIHVRGLNTVSFSGRKK